MAARKLLAARQGRYLDRYIDMAELREFTGINLHLLTKYIRLGLIWPHRRRRGGKFLFESKSTLRRLGVVEYLCQKRWKPEQIAELFEEDPAGDISKKAKVVIISSRKSELDFFRDAFVYYFENRTAVFSARDGFSGLNIICDIGPDIIIASYELAGGMNGLKVYYRLKTEPNFHPKFFLNIALTGPDSYPASEDFFIMSGFRRVRDFGQFLKKALGKRRSA